MTPALVELIDALRAGHSLSRDQFASLIRGHDAELRAHAAGLAREEAGKRFGNRIYVRGLIEFTNYCRNNCFYCGIRHGNRNVSRYRLDRAEILAACREGHRLGFRTFVLQGGEDYGHGLDAVAGIVSAIRSAHPDCAVTLSIGEHGREAYRRLFDAGATRYLLRHETADPVHYAKLHPASMSLDNRKRCLHDLKDIGFQTGCGFMVGSPFQTPENIADDLLFIRGFNPEMVGLGPFIPHRDTVFADCPPGGVELTLFILSLVRLLLPRALIPATTALGTLDGKGREKGILAGANVLMPNLSPLSVREKYLLYNDKASTGEEAAEHIDRLRAAVAAAGYEIVVDRGDYPSAAAKADSV